MMEKVAHKVIEKYQQTSCEGLANQKKQPMEDEQAQKQPRVIEKLCDNPKMREDFINRVAAPIATKLLQCGMIP